MYSFKKLFLTHYCLFVCFVGRCVDLPAVREWFVYPGNTLQEPDMVYPIPLSLPCTVHASYSSLFSSALLT